MLSSSWLPQRQWRSGYDVALSIQTRGAEHAEQGVAENFRPGSSWQPRRARWRQDYDAAILHVSGAGEPSEPVVSDFSYVGSDWRPRPQWSNPYCLVPVASRLLFQSGPTFVPVAGEINIGSSYLPLKRWATGFDVVLTVNTKGAEQTPQDITQHNVAASHWFGFAQWGNPYDVAVAYWQNGIIAGGAGVPSPNNTPPSQWLGLVQWGNPYDVATAYWQTGLAANTEPSGPQTFTPSDWRQPSRPIAQRWTPDARRLYLDQSLPIFEPAGPLTAIYGSEWIPRGNRQQATGNRAARYQLSIINFQFAQESIVLGSDWLQPSRTLPDNYYNRAAWQHLFENDCIWNADATIIPGTDWHPQLQLPRRKFNTALDARPSTLLLWQPGVIAVQNLIAGTELRPDLQFPRRAFSTTLDTRHSSLLLWQSGLTFVPIVGDALIGSHWDPRGQRQQATGNSAARYQLSIINSQFSHQFIIVGGPLAYQIKFAGLTLDGVTEWNEELPSRLNPETIPRRQGAIAPDVPMLGPRKIRLAGVVDKESGSALSNYLRSLGSKLSAGKAQLFRLDDNTYLNAVKENWSHGFKASENPSTRARVSIDFFASDPYWYSTTENVNEQLNLAAVPHSFQITNNGGEPTPVRVEIKALTVNKTGTFKLTDTTHGLSWQFTGTITANQILSVDGYGEDVEVVNSGANGQNEWTGSAWRLATGLNNLVYEGPTGVDVRVYWRERWS